MWPPAGDRPRPTDAMITPGVSRAPLFSAVMALQEQVAVNLL